MKRKATNKIDCLEKPPALLPSWGEYNNILRVQGGFCTKVWITVTYKIKNNFVVMHIYTKFTINWLFNQNLTAACGYIMNVYYGWTLLETLKLVVNHAMYRSDASYRPTLTCSFVLINHVKTTFSVEALNVVLNTSHYKFWIDKTFFSHVYTISITLPYLV